NFAMKISAGAKYFKKPSSDILRSLNKVVKVMAILIVPLGISLFCIKYLVQPGELNVTVINTIGTLIGMIPSGLVALSSAVFCISVIRLAKHKTLAQDMYCVETLARVDVLCLDKTGTITEGTMEVNSISPKAGRDENEIKQILKNFTEALAENNATANAIGDYVKDCASNASTTEIVPFSSARKWSGAYLNGRSYVLGAPEFVFTALPKEITSVTETMAEKGFRVLVLASSPNHFEGSNVPDDLTLESFVFITDKIRAEAPDTLRFFREQGVNVKIISGDNPATVRAVALRAGLEDCDNFIDMSTLKTDEEVIAAADKYTIFGRVLPDQKLLIIKSLKAAGHTVAMTGDGVNDVLALKAADCSIAMASGSDAAKNVSSLVLLDSNFASMPRVVAEGRRSINNLERSAALFLVKTIYTFLFAVFFMIISSELPFAPKHLTLIGGLTIGIPSFILALEPNNTRVTGRFLPKVVAEALPGSICVMLGVFGVLICDRFFISMSIEQTQVMYLIVTAFIGFVFLFKVSLPLNLWHILLEIVLISAFVGSFFLEIGGFNVKEFFGITNDITWKMGQALLSISAVLLAIFTVLSLFSKNLGKKFEEMTIDYETKKRAREALKPAKASKH
ncbi:MAG: HAD-IC family P-type ATPase, partial [Clostridia bacterium]